MGADKREAEWGNVENSPTEVIWTFIENHGDRFQRAALHNNEYTS